MDFKTFQNCIEHLPSNISVCIRGDHGIGKSEFVYQYAKKIGYEIIERRLSQMSEGDIIGLPIITDGITKFAPTDWYKKACEQPVVLFLDELNRATREIMQAAFQIVLDRTLNGHKLHPETRIFTAVNTTAHYDINDMDPSLLDRFWVVDLEPTVEDWIAWAKLNNNIHSMVYSFIKENEKHLECKGTIEPGKIYPSRRSWKRLNDILVTNDIISNPGNMLFYSLSIGLLGIESSIAFTNYAKNVFKQITCEDILDNWEITKERINILGNEKYNIIIEKLASNILTNLWSKQQMQNVVSFTKVLPSELKLVLYSTFIKNINEFNSKEPEKDIKNNICIKNIRLFNEHAKNSIIEIVKSIDVRT